MLVFRHFIPLGLVCLLLSPLVSAQQKSKVQLQVSETIFTVATSLNACGYSDGLNESEPVRAEVRKYVNQAVQASGEATLAKDEMCRFYREHQPSEANRGLSQYVSLALNLGDAPDFKPKLKEADMPPDTTYILGFVPLMARFYKATDLHREWTQVLPQYNALIEKFNGPLSQVILQTDLYLKNPISGYMGREFIIYLEPMGGPGKVNARNYGDDYFLLASPEGDQLPMKDIRHTYLHFVLDPMALKRPAAMKRLAPILRTVQDAPLEDDFKDDITLLVTESLIRAIEARLPVGKSTPLQAEKDVADDMSDGFVLTKYFYDSLAKFEKDPTSLKDAFGDFLYTLDVGSLAKRASEIHFRAKARTEVVKGGKIHEQEDPIDVAQQKLADGDLAGAEKIATDEVSKNSSDAPQAYFILGQVAALLHKDKDAAVKDFEETLRTAKDPKLIAWSHIYLGRIYDVDQDRELAVKHYQAALNAGDDTAQTKAAAQRGLEAPYQRRASTEEDKN